MKSSNPHPTRVIARSDTSAALCYDILGILGEGGSGVTYRAIDTQTQQLVALKALSLHQINDWKAIELFEREAKVLSTLDRDGIPKYLDYFTTDLDGDRYFYIVQALAPGKTLSEWMNSGWRVTEAELKPIIIQILEILIYLHRHHPPIVHRDLKPSNILKTEDGKISLVDFGAVQQTYHDTFMRGSTVVGTYGYMAPEQFRGQAVPVTDLYGLGATILHLLTHRSPAEIPQDGLRLNFRDRLQVSSSFADWLERILEPDVGSRFSSAAKALEVLKNPPKPKFKPTFGKFERTLMSISALMFLVLVFGVFERSKYYWLSMAGLISNEPFQAMSAKPSVERIQGYLDRGFNINATDANNRTLMYHAMSNDLPEIVKMLIERGADISDAANPIDSYEERVKLLQNQKKNFEKDLETHLAGDPNPSYAAQERQRRQDSINEQEKAIRENFINAIADYAVRRNRIPILELLIKRGVKLDKIYLDHNKLSFLHLASVHQDGAMVKILLDRGVDPNLQDSLGCTPLHTAIARDLMPYHPKLSSYVGSIDPMPSKKAIASLIKAGANLDLKCNLLSNYNSSSDRWDISVRHQLARAIDSKIPPMANINNYTSPAQLLLLDLENANKDRSF